ncbi:hypothetical protein ACYPKM_00225 [Pseudomonas aeruginosa]
MKNLLAAIPGFALATLLSLAPTASAAPGIAQAQSDSPATIAPTGSVKAIKLTMTAERGISVQRERVFYFGNGGETHMSDMRRTYINQYCGANSDTDVVDIGVAYDISITKITDSDATFSYDYLSRFLLTDRQIRCSDGSEQGSREVMSKAKITLAYNQPYVIEWNPNDPDSQRSRLVFMVEPFAPTKSQ